MSNNAQLRTASSAPFTRAEAPEVIEYLDAFARDLHDADPGCEPARMFATVAEELRRRVEHGWLIDTSGLATMQLRLESYPAAHGQVELHVRVVALFDQPLSAN